MSSSGHPYSGRSILVARERMSWVLGSRLAVIDFSCFAAFVCFDGENPKGAHVLTGYTTDVTRV